MVADEELVVGGEEIGDDRRQELENRKMVRSISFTEIVSLSLFVCLMIVLNDDESTKYAISGTGKPLIRELKDSSVHRDEYSDDVGILFNDPAVPPRVGMLRVPIEVINPASSQPTFIHRTKLEQLSHDIRVPFK